MTPVQFVEGQSDRQIARWLESRLDGALAATAGPIAVAMPGGSTPFPIMECLDRQALDWRRVNVWPGDERLVAPDHPASNLGKMRPVLEALGARVVELREGAVPPHFALVWLGMGLDGHIASLFPNMEPRCDDPARVVRCEPSPLPPEAPFARLSLTMAALLASDCLMFVIRGQQKRDLFEAALAGKNDLPVARLLAGAHQPIQCFT